MKNLKLGMLLVVVLAAVLLLQVAPGASVAQDQAAVEPTPTVAPTRTISVSGRGQIEAQPDEALVQLGVETNATEAAAALSQNNTQMQALINALTEAGVAQQDIQTQSVQLVPVYEQPSATSSGSQGQSTTPQLVGYQATNLVQVRIRNLDNLGQIIDAAVQAGGNRVQGISFEVSDTAALLDQAREAAWNDAQHKAEQLASLAGTELGDVLSISESSGLPQPIVERAVSAGAASPVPVSPGNQTIEVDLGVSWLLK